AAALYGLWRLLLVAVRITTTGMWFGSVHAGSVYATMLETRILLFAVFGVVAGLIGGLTLLAVARIRPALDLSPDYDTFRFTFRKHEPRFRILLVLAAAVVPMIMVGRAAAAGWQTYLLWRHVTPFHQTDPLFGRDASFFVEVEPFYQWVIGLLQQAVTYGFWTAVIAGYWYGTWRIRRGRRKITRQLIQLVSALAAGYLVLKAWGYWVSTAKLTTSTRGPVTGAGYTDIHASLPALYALAVIALVCAAALVANAVRVRRVRLLIGVVVLAVIAAQVVGTAVPGLVYRYREAPSAASLDLGEISNNLKATRTAFGLDGDVTTVPYSNANTTNTSTVARLATTTAQASVIDPNQLSPTFNVKQQLQSYYGFKSTLDTSHFDIGGKSQDVAMAVRELQVGSLPSGSWANQHVVYTHGYGVVAAPTTQVDPATESPVFLNGGMPPAQQIPVTQPQVYFGQGFGSSSYAIVGRPAGSNRNVEFDHPGVDGSSNPAYTTYQGHGGIPVGSTLRRLLFALQLKTPNIFFSAAVNKASQLLEIRNPAARVAKVAPWLTLDGDVYPAVVGGRIQWVVDGYTTTSNYPDSQLVNLRSATSTTLVADGASVAQPNTRINYMQNSVKAVVDAYTGKVTLYAWNQRAHPDPLLQAWESVFPGLVEPQSRIPSGLLSQLRYPTDLFNVQRTLLAQYHVTSPADFYSGNDFWSVPTDPTIGGASSINAKSAGTTSAALPSRYMSLSANGYGSPRYSLSSPMATLNGRDLAAFVSVDSQPGPSYGKFTVLDFPSSSGEAPSQVQNDIESDTKITESLTLQRGGNSKVVLGDLEAIPVAGRLLYVEPVYTQSSGSSSFPILRHVIALYANGRPSFKDDLVPAIRSAIRSAGTTGG
ncbi:MAG: UPF0182 family protein, partial [Microlunatus sp.]|nr:UPF0182 family protein [Microlunatus sp.]